MAKTIKEQIAANLQTELERITTANGFANDVLKVERWKQSGQNKKDWPIIHIFTGAEVKTNLPSLITSCEVSYYLGLWTKHDENKYPVTTDEYLNAFAGDMETAVMRDEQRSQLAVRTTVTEVDSFEMAEGQPFCGVLMTVVVEYKHKRGDPTIQL
jgi:hypothetical protein